MHCRWCRYLLTPEVLKTPAVRCIHCQKDNPHLLDTASRARRKLPTGQAKVLDSFNPASRRGQVQFWFEAFDHPKITALRKQFDHAAAMKGQGDEFHQQLALMNWFNRRIISSRGIDVQSGGRVAYGAGQPGLSPQPAGHGQQGLLGLHVRLHPAVRQRGSRCPLDQHPL